MKEGERGVKEREREGKRREKERGEIEEKEEREREREDKVVMLPFLLRNSPMSTK